MERAEKAHGEVYGLCDGSRKWRMCAPVQETDSDIVLVAALDDIPALAAAVTALSDEVEGLRGQGQAEDQSAEKHNCPDCEHYKPNRHDGLWCHRGTFYDHTVGMLRCYETYTLEANKNGACPHFAALRAAREEERND
jgi:hypothetical protein